MMSNRYDLRQRVPKTAEPTAAPPVAKATPKPKPKAKSGQDDDVATAAPAPKRKLDGAQSSDTKQPTAKKTRTTTPKKPAKATNVTKPNTPKATKVTKTATKVTKNITNVTKKTAAAQEAATPSFCDNQDPTQPALPAAGMNSTVWGFEEHRERVVKAKRTDIDPADWVRVRDFASTAVESAPPVPGPHPVEPRERSEGTEDEFKSAIENRKQEETYTRGWMALLAAQQNAIDRLAREDAEPWRFGGPERRSARSKSPEKVSTMQILQKPVEDAPAKSTAEGPETRHSKSLEKITAAPSRLREDSPQVSPKACLHVQYASPEKDGAPQRPKSPAKGITTQTPKGTGRAASPRRRIHEDAKVPWPPKNGESTSQPRPRIHADTKVPGLPDNPGRSDVPSPKTLEETTLPWPRKNPERAASPRRKVHEDTARPPKSPSKSPPKSPIRPLALPKSPTMGRQVATRGMFEAPKESVRSDSSSSAFSTGNLPGLQVAQTGFLARNSSIAAASVSFSPPLSLEQPPEPSNAAGGASGTNAPSAPLPEYLYPSATNQVLEHNIKLAHELAKTNPGILKAEFIDFATCPHADPKHATGFMLNTYEATMLGGRHFDPPKVPSNHDDLNIFPYGTFIRVDDGDIVDAALVLEDFNDRHEGDMKVNGPSRDRQHPNRRTLILNLTNPWRPAAGASYGEVLHEDELAYCTTLAASLSNAFFTARGPQGRNGLHDLAAVYSPEVVVVRRGMKHRLDRLHEGERRTVSVVTVAARKWQGTAAEHDPAAYYAPITSQSAAASDIASFLRNQMRLVLRVAAKYNHTRLILNDFGGADVGYPTNVIAGAFLQVVREREFTGGRWEYVFFQVPEKFAVKDLEGNVVGDPSNDNKAKKILNTTGLGKKPFMILKRELDCQLI